MAISCTRSWKYIEVVNRTASSKEELGAFEVASARLCCVKTLGGQVPAPGAAVNSISPGLDAPQLFLRIHLPFEEHGSPAAGLVQPLKKYHCELVFDPISRAVLQLCSGY